MKTIAWSLLGKYCSILNCSAVMRNAGPTEMKRNTIVMVTFSSCWNEILLEKALQNHIFLLQSGGATHKWFPASNASPSPDCNLNGLDCSSFVLVPSQFFPVDRRAFNYQCRVSKHGFGGWSWSVSITLLLLQYYPQDTSAERQI